MKNASVTTVMTLIGSCCAFASWLFNFDKKQKHRHTAMAAVLGIAALVYNSYFGVQSDGPVVQTIYGSLRGSPVQKSREGRDYYQFLGIPYSRPPIGSLRFEPPEPPLSWLGIKKAQKFGPECMQREVMVTGREIGEEDCLYLNVYTPNIGDAFSFPVMVFIHGGLFMTGGSNMYKAKYFMDEKTVLVTFNYRLAALGFLNTGDGVIRGNMGLKDQVMALKWVKANIKAFGGNPNQVTIFGESAGAASVHFLMLSPLSKGLFHKAISQSGTALKIWALNKNPRQQALHLGSQMGCPIHNSKLLIHCLKNKDASELVRVSMASMSPIRSNMDLYVPTVETFLREDTFLSDEPEYLLKNGSFHKIPWMIGVNQGEGLLNTGRILASPAISQHLSSQWNKWIPMMLDYDANRVDISKKIRQNYFGRSMNSNPLNNIMNLTQMYSDRVYFHATHKAAKIHSPHAPVFLYYYTYPGELSFFRLFKAVMPDNGDLIPPELKIAADVTKDLIMKYIMRNPSPQYGISMPCHADELFMLFNMHMLTEVRKNSADYLVSKSIVKSWVDFSTDTDQFSLKYQNQPWPFINPTGVLRYMNLDKKGSLINEPFRQSIEFWESLGL